MGASVDQLISSFAGLCMLLLLGKFLRVCIPILQRLFLPSSVIGGLAGLLILQLSKLNDGHVYDYLSQWWIMGWSDLAGFLINIVFASLFLGVNIPPVKTVWKQAGPQLMYGMFLNWGQWIAALLVTGMLLKPVWGVPELFAVVADVGFAGGHGTAAGLAPTFEQLEWKAGTDLSLFAATLGLVISIVMGVAFVNIGVWKGWLKKETVADPRETTLSVRAAGIYPEGDQPSAGSQTVSADSIDVLAFHLSVIGLAMGIGWLFKRTLIALENTNEPMEDLGFFNGMPSFPLCMLGGIIVQTLSSKMDMTRHLIDAKLMERLSGTSLDFLITAAVASLDVNALSDDIVPLVILLGTVLVWQILAFFLLARFLLPNHWVERALAEFGMATGVIASGLVLLRMVDPESKTPAPADFAYKQLLHSPFMGGGVWTAASLPIVAKAGLWPTFVICSLIFTAWVGLWWWHFRPQYGAACRCKKCRELAEYSSEHMFDEEGEDEVFHKYAGGDHQPSLSVEPLINSSGSESEYNRPISSLMMDDGQNHDDSGLQTLFP